MPLLRGRKPSPSPKMPPVPINMPTHHIPSSHPFIIPLPIDPEMFVQDVVDGKIPRPCNSWILFRREVTRNWPSWMGPLPAQGKVSGITKELWDSLPIENRQLWDDLAEQIKALHKLRFPDYKFKPMKREEKERLVEAKKQAAAEKKEQARLAKLNKSNAAASRGPVSVAHSTRAQPYYFPATHFSQFHPAGVSPAMSYASLADDEEAHPTAASSSASPAAESPFPKTPLTQPTSPLPYPFEQFQVAEKAADAVATSAPETEAVEFFDTEAAAGIYQAWEGVDIPASTSTEQPAEEYNYNGMSIEELTAQSMLFTVPPPTFNAVDNWLVTENATTFDSQVDFMNNNVDFQAFELNNFPDLNTNKPGPLDVYLGPLSPSLDPALLLATEVSGNNLGSFYALDQIPAAPNDGDFNNNNDFIMSLFANIFDGQQYQAEQTYLAQPYQLQQPYQTQEQMQPMFNQDIFGGDQSLKNMALQPVENTAVDYSAQSYTPAVEFTSTSAYAPPAGASNSGFRRAGGSYKKDLHYQSSMSDLEL